MGSICGHLTCFGALAADAGGAQDSSKRAEIPAEDLRSRLTEREDKPRPEDPLSIDVAGRPLTIGGEYEVIINGVKRRVLGEDVQEPDQVFFEQQLELEGFYTFGPPLSFFAQLRLGMEEDLLRDTFDDTSNIFIERGEMWIYGEDVAGTGLNVDFGRLSFEDDRRWWWDDELDAVRASYEADDFEIALSVAHELGANRSDQTGVAPENDSVVRILGEISWDWSPNHAAELFLLHQDDRSSREVPGQVVKIDRQDDFDARLTWFGARLTGAAQLDSEAILGYWLDTALVNGDERVADFEDLTNRRGVVDGVSRRDVDGWAIDMGVTWILPKPWEPRLFAGFAYGSGDSTPDQGADRSFRQTGFHSNEAGFGGVEGFSNYGVLLDPELSNLRILTAGFGLSLMESSSLDLVYHQYRLGEPATSLRDSRLEVTLDGNDRELGQEVDAVLALEEWDTVELHLTASAFEAGRAFGDHSGVWSYGGSISLRIAF